jgi:FkbM family methyltransferase
MFKSQFRQDEYLDKEIFKHKEKGYFVEIGAAEGVQFSNTYFFEKKRGWRGVCIEPRKRAFDQLVKNRTCICENVAINGNSGNSKFLEIDGDEAMLSGLVDTYDPRHLERIKKEVKDFEKNVKKVTVPTITFDDLLKKQEVFNIDYLSIDTEGGELDILKSIPFGKYTINVISVENNYDNLELRTFLESKGFYFRKKLKVDEIYTRAGWDDFKPSPQIGNTFSIITPSLNQGQYIEETIKSVLSQEGDFHIEYIIADGGSTDGALEVIKRYDELIKNGEYPIKCKGITYTWWSKKDGGQVQAINQAIRKCSGDIITWLNTDDYYLPGALQFVYAKFLLHPEADLIYGDSYVCNEDSKMEHKPTFQGGKRELLEYNIVDQASSFFTRRIVNKIGYFNEKLSCRFDHEYWIRIAEKSVMLHFDKPLSVYRLWHGSKTVSMPLKFATEEKMIWKMYGRPILSRRRIYSITTSKTVTILKTAMPTFYGSVKKVFYFFYNNCLSRVIFKKPFSQ